MSRCALLVFQNAGAQQKKPAVFCQDIFNTHEFECNRTHIRIFSLKIIDFKDIKWHKIFKGSKNDHSCWCIMVKLFKFVPGAASWWIPWGRRCCGPRSLASSGSGWPSPGQCWIQLLKSPKFTIYCQQNMEKSCKWKYFKVPLIFKWFFCESPFWLNFHIHY